MACNYSWIDYRIGLETLDFSSVIDNNRASWSEVPALTTIFTASSYI